MLTTPKSQTHHLFEGQVVELLPWLALMTNGQKTAQLSGYLAEVIGGYNPNAQDFYVKTPHGNDNGNPSRHWGERWQGRGDKASYPNTALARYGT